MVGYDSVNDGFYFPQRVCLVRREHLKKAHVLGQGIVERGTGQDAHLFIPDVGEPLLMVRRSYERACAESPLETVSQVNSLSSVADCIRASGGHGIGPLGMELDVLPTNHYFRYKEAFRERPIVDIAPLVRQVRMVKSRFEIEQIRNAAEMNDRMFSRISDVLREGLTELHFAGMLEALYREYGHQGLIRVRSFNQDIFYGHLMSGPNLAVAGSSLGPMAGTGPNPSFPQSAGHKTIRRHEPVMVDYVGTHNGYLVGQARIFSIGKLDDEFLRAYYTALAIQQSLMEEARPGCLAEELFESACRLAHETGLGDRFMGYPDRVGFVGHGIGLEVDELPLIGCNSPIVLEEGMVVALEPKFFFPGKGVAGLENTFVVGPRGLQKVTLFDDAVQVL